MGREIKAGARTVLSGLLIPAQAGFSAFHHRRKVAVGFQLSLE